MNAVGIDVSKGKSMVAIMFGLTAFVVICELPHVLMHIEFEGK